MSWIEDAKKLAAATVLVKETVDDELAAWRFSICNACELLDRERIVCTVCGCYMQIKTKAKTSRSPARPLGEVTHCPMGKWNDKDICNHYRAIDGKELL